MKCSNETILRSNVAFFNLMSALLFLKASQVSIRFWDWLIYIGVRVKPFPYFLRFQMIICQKPCTKLFTQLRHPQIFTDEKKLISWKFLYTARRSSGQNEQYCPTKPSYFSVSPHFDIFGVVWHIITSFLFMQTSPK